MQIWRHEPLLQVPEHLVKSCKNNSFYRVEQKCGNDKCFSVVHCRVMLNFGQTWKFGREIAALYLLSTLL